MSDLDDMGLGDRPDALGDAKARRDEGMAAAVAADPEWCRKAVLAVIQNVPPGTKGLFEVFRTRITPIVGAPSSPNAWGPVARWLKDNGYILDTGEFDHPVGKKSNASKKSVVIRTDKMPGA